MEPLSFSFSSSYESIQKPTTELNVIRDYTPDLEFQFEVSHGIANALTHGIADGLCAANKFDVGLWRLPRVMFTDGVFPHRPEKLGVKDSHTRTLANSQYVLTTDLDFAWLDSLVGFFQWCLIDFNSQLNKADHFHSCMKYRLRDDLIEITNKFSCPRSHNMIQVYHLEKNAVVDCLRDIVNALRVLNQEIELRGAQYREKTNASFNDALRSILQGNEKYVDDAIEVLDQIISIIEAGASVHRSFWRPLEGLKINSK